MMVYNNCGCCLASLSCLTPINLQGEGGSRGVRPSGWVREGEKAFALGRTGLQMVSVLQAFSTAGRVSCLACSSPYGGGDVGWGG